MAACSPVSDPTIRIPRASSAAVRNHSDLRVVWDAIDTKDLLYHAEYGFNAVERPLTPNAERILRSLADFLDFSKSSLTPYEARALTYKLGLTSPAMVNNHPTISAGDRVEFSFRGKDGRSYTTQGIVVSAWRPKSGGSSSIDILATDEKNRLRVFFSGVAGGPKISKVVTPALQDGR